MAEPTLQEIFGAGATQTATTITILKSDLDLTASATNRGEQVFAAVVKKAGAALTSTDFDTNSDQSIVVNPTFEQVVYRTVNNVQTAFLKTPVEVSFHKLQVTGGITPNDY